MRKRPHNFASLTTLKAAAIGLSLMLAAPASAAFLSLSAVPILAQYRPDHLPDGPPAPIPAPDITLKTNAMIPQDLEFTRSDGVKMKLAELFKSNKPVILQLVYFSCPNLCGFSQDALVQTVRTGPRGLDIGSDYTVVVVSIDPDDTLADAATKRQHYLAMMGRKDPEPGVIYLTGTEPNIRQLADTVGFGYKRNFDVQANDSMGKYAHSAGIFVVTPYGRLSQTIIGLNYLPDDLHYALVQASEGKLGSGLLGIGLSCGAVHLGIHGYEANPWFWVGTAGGLASLGFTTIFLGMMWRGEFKKKRLSKMPPDAKAALP